jgi:hypothetical protein
MPRGKGQPFSLSQLSIRGIMAASRTGRQSLPIPELAEIRASTLSIFERRGFEFGQGSRPRESIKNCNC